MEQITEKQIPVVKTCPVMERLDRKLEERGQMRKKRREKDKEGYVLT